MDDMDAIVEMTQDEAWSFLAQERLGRLAFRLFEAVEIVPMNHVVDGDRIIFRTAEGNKLLGIATAGEVAFEVDWVGDGEAASVIAFGHARILEGHEAEHADTLPLHPWIPTLKYNYVAIDVTRISGRRFHLGEEPERTFGVY